MAKMRDRLHLHDHEVDERFGEIVEREGAPTEAPVREIPEREPGVAKPARKPTIRWMQWLAGAIVVMLVGAVIAVVAFRGDGTEPPSTYVGDPQAELQLIEQAVADFQATTVDVADAYVADAYAELELIEQAVADYRNRPSTYIADPYVELELIEQAVAGDYRGVSTYVADAYAELELIEQAVADYRDRPSTYVPDPYAELELIDRLAAE